MQFTPATKPFISLEEQARQICLQRGYQFESFLGSGAFKECFSVRSTSGEPLALKILKPGFSRSRLGREIQAMQQCDHLHIAKLHEVSSVDIDGSKYGFLIEELLLGGTLQAYIANNGLLTHALCKDLA